MEKYYTPSSEELRVGFECEIKLHTGEWKSIKLTEESMKTIYSSVDIIRVRILDREDVESLDWGNYEPPYEYNHTWSLRNYKLVAWFNKDFPVIRIVQDYPIIFQGEIKNKSELEVLLKQLGIIDERNNKMYKML